MPFFLPYVMLAAARHTALLAAAAATLLRCHDADVAAAYFFALPRRHDSHARTYALLRR